MPPTLSPDDLHILLAEADAAAARLRRRLRLPHAELADLRQELLADLIARLRFYDPARGSLGAFAGVVLRNQSCRIMLEIARERRLYGAEPVSLDEPLLEVEDASRRDVVAEADELSAWHGQETDAAAEVERRLDVAKALGGLDRRDAALCARLSVSSVERLVAGGAGARSTLYRRLREIRMALAAHGVGPAWHGFRAV